jgi:hypothetical protein
MTNRALRMAALLGVLLLPLLVPAAAHAHGWLLWCPQAPDQVQVIDMGVQLHAYDWAAECEQVRPAFEANCRTVVAQGTRLAHTCACRCLPAK